MSCYSGLGLRAVVLGARGAVQTAGVQGRQAEVRRRGVSGKVGVWVGNELWTGGPRVQSRDEWQGLDPSVDREMCHPDPSVREDLSPQLSATSGLVSAVECCLTPEYPS